MAPHPEPTNPESVIPETPEIRRLSSELFSGDCLVSRRMRVFGEGAADGGAVAGAQLLVYVLFVYSLSHTLTCSLSLSLSLTHTHTHTHTHALSLSRTHTHTLSHQKHALSRSLTHTHTHTHTHTLTHTQAQEDKERRVQAGGEAARARFLVEMTARIDQGIARERLKAEQVVRPPSQASVPFLQ